MAVTKIWVIKDSLQRVLDYAANPDKTEYDALAQTLHYAENDAKTKLNESAQLVTGIHWTMRGKICGLYRNALVKQTAWWRSMPTKASARERLPRSNAMRSAWHWLARSGASVSKCWSLPI